MYMFNFILSLSLSLSRALFLSHTGAVSVMSVRETVEPSSRLRTEVSQRESLFVLLQFFPKYLTLFYGLKRSCPDTGLCLTKNIGYLNVVSQSLCVLTSSGPIPPRALGCCSFIKKKIWHLVTVSKCRRINVISLYCNTLCIVSSYVSFFFIVKSCHFTLVVFCLFEPPI